MDVREERGLVIANTSKIEQNKLGWKVPSQSGNGTFKAKPLLRGRGRSFLRGAQPL